MTFLREIRGHDGPITFLQTAFRSEKLAHALIFAGPAGVGKQSVALGFAAWALCTAEGDDACGACSACRQVAAGSHPDLMVARTEDGKKEIGVAKAREIKKFSQLAPMSASTKFIVIDDAEQLSVAAQNGLLKTLEDPTAESILILVASNPEGLLPTVRSRCQRVRFQPLKTPDVAGIIGEREGVADETAQRLAGLAEGSPGRAFALHSLIGDETSLLARIDQAAGGRYVDLASLAKAIGEPEAKLPGKLELLLAELRNAAANAATSGEPPARVRRELNRAHKVSDAIRTLRRGSPNKQLLLDSLLIQLTSHSG